jgi:hypothetical protein
LILGALADEIVTYAANDYYGNYDSNDKRSPDLQIGLVFECDLKNPLHATVAEVVYS